MNDYSPYQEAGQAFQSIGESANRLLIGIAQLRDRQAQQQFQNSLQMAYRAQQMERMRKLDESTSARDKAYVGSLGAREELDRARLNAADRIAGSVNARYTDNLLMNGPTIEAGRRLSIGQVEGDKARVSALGGRQYIEPRQHNIPLNAVSLNEVTGERQMGNVGGAPGHSYFTDEGQYDVPQQGFAPAGSTPMIREGTSLKQAGEQTGFRPGSERRGIPSYHPGSQYGSPYVFDPNDMRLFPVIEPQGTNTGAAKFGAPLEVPGYAPTTPTTMRSAGRTITATNPKTGKKIRSDDGGNSWFDVVTGEAIK